VNDKEEFIIRCMFYHEEYGKQISPFLKAHYFDELDSKPIINTYKEYVDKYSKIPTIDTVMLLIEDNKKLNERVNLVKFLRDVKKKEENIIIKNAQGNNAERQAKSFDIEYLMDSTEDYFRRTVLNRAVYEAADILNSTDPAKDSRKDSLPDMMAKALALSFKEEIGREYGTEVSIDNQYDHYHSQERRYPLVDWPHFTHMLRGGVSKKRLHIFMSGTGVGKTLWLINVAEQLMSIGLDVLYVSLEIAEEDIIERIDGNLLKTDTDKLMFMPKEEYKTRLLKLMSKKNSDGSACGRFHLKEYPPATITCGTLKHLLKELATKKNFMPTVLIVDYLNLMNSQRFKNASDTYSYVKGVTEELRGLAGEKKLICFSATQFNRSGMTNSDPDIDNISDSVGTAFSADFVAAVIESTSLRTNNQQQVKLLKSRYTPIEEITRRWLVNVDKNKQLITELSDYTSEESRGMTPLKEEDRPKNYKSRERKSEEKVEKVDLIQPKKDYKLPHVEAMEKQINEVKEAKEKDMDIIF
jgi:hypothetical protein